MGSEHSDYGRSITIHPHTTYVLPCVTFSNTSVPMSIPNGVVTARIEGNLFNCDIENGIAILPKHADAGEVVELNYITRDWRQHEKNQYSQARYMPVKERVVKKKKNKMQRASRKANRR